MSISCLEILISQARLSLSPTKFGLLSLDDTPIYLQHASVFIVAKRRISHKCNDETLTRWLWPSLFPYILKYEKRLPYCPRQ